MSESMQKSITFEVNENHLVALSIPLNMFKDWSQMTFNEFQQSSCVPVTYSDYLLTVQTHKTNYESIKQLGDNIAQLMGLLDLWESFND